MKKILVAVIGLFVFIACSKNDDNKKAEQYLPINILEQARMLAKDTSNLTVMGYCYNAATPNPGDTLIFTGTRGNKFWFGVYTLLNEKSENNLEISPEIFSYTTQHEYSLNREIDLGYGEKKNFTIKTFSIFIWGNGINDFEFEIIGKQESIATKWISDFVIVRNGIEHYYKEENFYNSKLKWFDNSMLFTLNDPGGVMIGAIFKRGSAIYSKNGEYLYTPKYTASNFQNIEAINMEEGIKYNTGESFEVFIGSQSSYVRKGDIYRVNIKENNTIWIGDINSNLDMTQNPLLTFNLTKKEGHEWYYKIDILNYNGSKETKNFKVNIETGEVTKL